MRIRNIPSWTVVSTVVFLICFRGDPARAQNVPTDDLYPLTTKKGVVYIDHSGTPLIKTTASAGWEFSEGLAAVAFHIGEQRTGYVDKSGKLVIPPDFGVVHAFHNGRALASPPWSITKEKFGGDLNARIGDWGYIDTTGKYVIQPILTDATDFSEGLAIVETLDGKYSLIDVAGKGVTLPGVDSASEFSDGLACVSVGGKYGYIDRHGDFAIKPQFEFADSFSEGLAKVKIGDKWGYIDKTGQVAIKPEKYKWARGFSEGLAAVTVDDQGTEKLGYIDRTGKMVIQPQYYYAGEFSDGLAAVSTFETFFMVWGGYRKSGYIDHDGRWVIKPQYLEARAFHKGLAFVIARSFLGFASEYIDKNGKVIAKGSI